MAAKIFTIEKTRVGLQGSDFTTRCTGTLEELKEYFSYTLEVGKSWENEKGNKKVNTNPKSIKLLVSNLDKAAANKGSHYQSEYFELVETTDQDLVDYKNKNN